jgi:Zn-dependent protease with chaperone function
VTVWLIAAAVAIGVLLLAVPHRLRLDDAPSSVAIAIWSSVLSFRAAICVVGAAGALIVLPTTAPIDAVARWCWHTVLPGLAAHLGLNGHQIADAAVLLPAMVLLLSAVSVLYALLKALRAVRRLLSRTFGPGPQDSMIVGDASIVIAAAGLRRPRVVVSAGALTSLDDSELYASLAHERGHIERRHRWILLFGELCRALGRPIPGSRAALNELAFHLERDADRYALARDHDAGVLAAAIFKAAASPSGLTAAPAAGLAGSGVARRLAQLLAPGQPATTTFASARVLATALTTVALLFAAAVPPVTLAAVSGSGSLPGVDCPH